MKSRRTKMPGGGRDVPLFFSLLNFVITGVNWKSFIKKINTSLVDYWFGDDCCCYCVERLIQCHWLGKFGQPYVFNLSILWCMYTGFLDKHKTKEIMLCCNQLEPNWPNSVSRWLWHRLTECMISSFVLFEEGEGVGLQEQHDIALKHIVID